jgi:ABC-type nitrate/sulfonate/bicarbonate transport system permease component
MGVSRLEEVYEVVFPAAVPTILTGVRIGLIFSFVIIVSSEMILAQTGLGVLVTDYGQFGQYAKVFAVISWIAILVAGIDRLYLLLTNRLLSWSERGVGGI